MGSFNRRQEADDLTDYVNNGWLSSAEFDGPTFLWNHLIREASQEDAAQRNDVPVANLSDADVVINMPMQWYFDALASMVPTAERTDTGVEIPRIDMPSFSIDSQALSGAARTAAAARRARSGRRRTWSMATCSRSSSQ